MSLRDEMMRAISSHPLDDYAATDAALAVVRSHVNRLADELQAEAFVYENHHIMATRALALHDAARSFRALCEEQTEDEK